MLRIDKIMKEHNINTLQLAEIMNVSPQYVSEVVNERKNITITVLPRLSFLSVNNGPVKRFRHRCSS